MNPRSIQYVLRTLTETSPTVSDAELLRRFAANEEAAFGELVRRHGRLVWAVCRHLTRSDAEADDAFQATFLVLLKNAKKVRDAGKLSAWLHGVAFKVCAKSRLAARRRSAREQASAVREGVGSAVPDSAWDRALVAVHEEVAKLPETQRVPFVLCCLEGLGVTEAAEQLGWKLGTLSGRLTRAKDAVLLKLEARGLTMGVVASVGLVTVPAAVTAKAAALAQVGFAIPGSIFQLSQGVIGMSLKPVKLLAAAVILTCGLGLSVGTGWVTNAEAQTGSGGAAPAKPKAADPEAEVKLLQAELERTREVAERHAKLANALNDRLKSELVTDKPTAPAFNTAKWEYDNIEMAATFDKTNFAAYLQEREAKGWEFLGSITLGKSGGVFYWLFRRPVKGAMVIQPPSVAAEGARVPVPNYGAVSEYYRRLAGNPEDAKSIEAEISKLQEKLKSFQLKPVQVWVPTENPTELAALLMKMANKKFGNGRAKVLVADDGVKVADKGFHLDGDQEVIDWATGVLKSLLAPSGGR